MKLYDAVIAGYFCVDLIPGFNKELSEESFRPGKLIEINGLDYTLGGVVANAGMAMKKFGKKVWLNGLAGDDFMGEVARQWLEKHGVAQGIPVMKNSGTGVGIVISPPGIDRIFLESPGCNRFFDIEHINMGAVFSSRLFHFGYPPLLRQFYANGGSQLEKLFSMVSAGNVITSLDFSLPDQDSESGIQDWDDILRRVLPHTDIFVPSLEEALQILMPTEFKRIQSLAGSGELIDHVDIEVVREAGRRMISYGASVVMIKAGHRGAYLVTGDVSRVARKDSKSIKEEDWSHSELWCDAYPADSSRFKNASGAGDSAAAAFLSAFLDQEGPETALKYAMIAGRNNLYCNDIFNEMPDWKEMTRQVNTEPGKIFDPAVLAAG